MVKFLSIKCRRVKNDNMGVKIKCQIVTKIASCAFFISETEISKLRQNCV